MKTSNKVIVLLSIVLLLVTVLALIETQKQKGKLADLQEIIKEQEETIKKQMTKETQKVQVNEKAIAKGFLEEWKKVIGRDAPYEGAVVGGEVMKIYFSDEYEAVAFVSHTPEVIARFALDYLLKETGRKTGTVEYYTPLKKKIYSLSESPFGTESEKYDKEEE
jgi:hypothetical protein